MKKYNETILKEIENIKEVFEEPIKIINEGCKLYDIIRYLPVKCRTLRHCYKSYSIFKEEVYNNYLNIYSKLFDSGFDGCGYGVYNYNKMLFTLVMLIKKNNVYYKIFITKSYNNIIAYEEV